MSTKISSFSAFVKENCDNKIKIMVSLFLYKSWHKNSSILLDKTLDALMNSYSLHNEGGFPKGKSVSCGTVRIFIQPGLNFICWRLFNRRRIPSDGREGLGWGYSLTAVNICLVDFPLCRLRRKRIFCQRMGPYAFWFLWWYYTDNNLCFMIHYCETTFGRMPKGHGMFHKRIKPVRVCAILTWQLQLMHSFLPLVEERK